MSRLLGNGSPTAASQRRLTHGARASLDGHGVENRTVTELGDAFRTLLPLEAAGDFRPAAATRWRLVICSRSEM